MIQSCCSEETISSSSSLICTRSKRCPALDWLNGEERALRSPEGKQPSRRFYVLKAVSRKLFWILAMLASRFSSPLLKSSSSPDESGDTSPFTSSSSKSLTSNRPGELKVSALEDSSKNSTVPYGCASRLSTASWERLLVSENVGFGCDDGSSEKRKCFLCKPTRWSVGFWFVKASSFWPNVRTPPMADVRFGVAELLPCRVVNAGSSRDNSKAVVCPLLI